MKLALLNTTIATNDGCYQLHSIDLATARLIFDEALKHDAFVSHIGHSATAQIMGELLRASIEVSRTPLSQVEGQAALCLKLGPEGQMFRAEESRIYTAEEMKAIGYSFKLLIRLPDACAQPSDLRSLFEVY